MTMRGKVQALLVLFIIFFVLVTSSDAMISAVRSEWIDLYRSRAWIYQNVGAPDSVEWNDNFGTNLEIYRISNSPNFDSTFIGYGGDGIVHVMGQFYRPGTATVASIRRMLVNQGGTLIQSNWNGYVYSMRHIKTNRPVYAVVEPNANLGPVLYILTSEGWNSLQ